MNRIFNPLICPAPARWLRLWRLLPRRPTLWRWVAWIRQTAADDIKTGLYALVGVVALIYLIYLGVMAFTEKILGRFWVGRGVRLLSALLRSAAGLDTVRLMP